MKYPLRFTSLSPVALLLALAACGDDSTGPLFGTRISVSVEAVDDPIIYEDVPGEPRIRCGVTFRAAASGGDRATWRDGSFRFFIGPNRTTAVDTLTFSAEEIGGSWGGPTLSDGQSVESEWVFHANAPFVVAATYRYSPSGGTSVAEANTRFACGPEPSANSPLPTVSDVSVAPPWDGLEPGDVLSVRYTVDAPLGIWAVVIELSGACQRFVEFGEQLQTTVSRTRLVQMPADCALGVPLHVTIHAVDAALRFSSFALPGPMLVDHTPPTVAASLISPFGIVNDLGTVYFVRDTIQMNVWASDNNVVRSIDYEILPLGLRDSVVVGPSFGNRLRVPLRPEMTGSIQLRIHARDASGLTSAPYTTQANTIHVFPTVDRPTLQTSLDGRVEDLVIDAERGAIYVMQWNVIRVLSATTLQTIRTIELPNVPTSLDFTPGGDSLVFTFQTGLGIIDLRPQTPVVSQFPLVLDASVMQRPGRVVVMANGKAFVALDGNAAGAAVLLEVNLVTGDQRVRTDAADASGVTLTGSMQRSPDRLAFVFNGGTGHFRRYDATTDQFTASGSTVQMSGSGYLSVAGSGPYTAIGRLIYDGSLTFVRRVESIWGAANLVPATALSADGQYLYIGGRPGLMRSRVSDGKIVDRTMNPVPGDIFRVAGDDSFVVTATQTGPTQLSLIRMR